jgi:DeoR family fructose operon transcriptional repressor
MLAKQRLLLIQQELKNKKFLTVNEICALLNVSKSTIQRDLDLLEKDHKLIRERGGAALINYQNISTLDEISIMDKVDLNVKDKKELCKEAVKEIKDGDTIFLDTGTTVSYITDYIGDKNINVITNSIFVVNKLNGNNINVYLLGGKYSSKYKFTHGIGAIEDLNKFRIDKSFISGTGISLKYNEVYGSDTEVAAIKKEVIKRSGKAYLLVDNTKFNITGISVFASVNDYYKVFTNKVYGIPKKYKNIMNCS